MEARLFILIKNIVLAFGLAILLPIVMHKGINLFYNAPEYSLPEHTTPLKKDFKKLEAWEEAMDEFNEQVKQETKIYQKEWDEKNRVYSERYFFIALFIGVFYILLGAFTPIQSVSTGLIVGGIFSLLIGIIHHWNYFGELSKFLSLVGAVILLIVTAFIITKRNP